VTRLSVGHEAPTVHHHHILHDDPHYHCASHELAEPAFTTECARLDRGEWCDAVSHESNLRALCFSACMGDEDETWMEECAWQAIHDLPAVCAGTFSPEPPKTTTKANFDDDDDEDDDMFGGERAPSSTTRAAVSSISRKACTTRAMCEGCRRERGSSFCGAVVDHYGTKKSATALRIGDVVVNDARAEAALRALNDDLDTWCAAIGVDRAWSSAAKVDESTFSNRWRSAPSSQPQNKVVRVEEHYLYGKPALLSGVFLKQAYAFWRYVLNGRRALRASANMDSVLSYDVEVTTKAYYSRSALLRALSQRDLAPGAVVFIDVIFEAMDTEWRFKELAGEPHNLRPSNLLQIGDLEMSKVDDYELEDDLDFLCVYQHTPNVLLRSTLLRELLAYELPLVIVLAGDADCRLKRSVLPNATHHTLIFPNDGACASQVDGAGDSSSRLWWPEGLEGVDGPSDLGPIESQGGFEADAALVADSPVASLEDRPFLFDCAISVTPRKPSRVTLLDYLRDRGGAEALRRVAQDTRLRLRLRATTTTEGDDSESSSSDERRRRLSRSSSRDDDDGVSSSPSQHSRGYYSKKNTNNRGGKNNNHHESSSESSKATKTVFLLDTGDAPGSPVNSSSSDGGDGAAVFSLAPAGDTWSSGRVLEAVLRGAVPIVDQTYRTDGISDKGCTDAAKFWREGTADFPYPAPFVFVDSWDALPEKLLDAASDPAKLAERLRAVQTYRDALVAYLRNATLEAILRAQRFDDSVLFETGGAASLLVREDDDDDSRPSPPNINNAGGDALMLRQRRRGGVQPPPSTPPAGLLRPPGCVTVPLDAEELEALDREAAAYYATETWFDAFEDSPRFPGSGCTTAYFTDGRKSHGAMCFDPRCAPPTVRSFECGVSASGIGGAASSSGSRDAADLLLRAGPLEPPPLTRAGPLDDAAV